MGWNPFQAWVCSVSDPQYSINELLNCILRIVGKYMAAWCVLPQG